MMLRILLILLWMVPVHAATLVDMVGRSLELQAPPRRIVSLAPSVTEILFALDAEDDLVGVTDFDDYPPEARTKQRVGGGIDPNLEVIVALKPDLVFVSADANQWGTISQLERLHIPVFGVKPVGVEGVFESIRKVGQVVGRERQAAALSAEMRRRMEAVSERVSGRSRPKVLCAVWIDPLIVAGRGTVIDDLIRMAGGVNIVEGPGFPRYGLEAVLRNPPDVILLAIDRGGPGDGEALRRLPVWKELRAVHAGGVRAIDAGVVNRPGPRIATALELFARMLHHESFEGSVP